MRLYDAPIAFKASPASTMLTRELGLPSHLSRDVIAEYNKKSVRVRKAKSPAEASSQADELQSAFETHALPEDVARRLRERFGLAN